jgi:hypothetical protein
MQDSLKKMQSEPMMGDQEIRESGLGRAWAPTLLLARSGQMLALRLGGNLRAIRHSTFLGWRNTAAERPFGATRRPFPIIPGSFRPTEVEAAKATEEESTRHRRASDAKASAAMIAARSGARRKRRVTNAA